MDYFAFRPAALRQRAGAAEVPWRNATLACVHEPGKNWWVEARANPEGLLYRLADLYRLRVSLLGGRAHGRRVHELGPGGVWHAHDTRAVDAWLASGRMHD